MNWQIRAGTSNRKLGPTAYVVSLSSDTCPTTCPLKAAGCYAKQGHLRIHWDRLDRGEASDGPGRWTGVGFRTLSATLRKVVPAGALLRIGDVGDPSHNGKVSLELMTALGRLRRRGVRPIVYTHCIAANNVRAETIAQSYGFALNFSGHGVAGALGSEGMTDRVTTVAPDYWATHPERSNLMRRCPAETRESVTCQSCGLCAQSRSYAVAFTAHGSQSRSVAEVSR